MQRDAVAGHLGGEAVVGLLSGTADDGVHRQQRGFAGTAVVQPVGGDAEVVDTVELDHAGVGEFAPQHPAGGLA